MVVAVNLHEALTECTLALLRRIATAHGLAVSESTLRAELVDQLAGKLAEPEQMNSLLTSLSTEEQRLLQAVRTQGWTAKAFVLDRQFPGDQRKGGDNPPSMEHSPKPSLVQKGLLYRSYATLGNWRGEVYHVPEELRQAIDAGLPPEPMAKGLDIRSSADPPTTVERNVAFDVFCLLSYLRRSKCRTVHGSLGRADVGRLEEEVREVSTDWTGGLADQRWAFLLHLCLAGGWVVRQGNLLTSGRRAAQLLAGGPIETQRRLLERYLRDRGWSDLSAAGRVRQALGSRTMDEPTGRRLVLHHLEELGGDGWVEEGAFRAAIRTLNPDLLREDYASPSWGMVDVATEGELHGSPSWDPVEGEWIRYLLRGPFSWLGLVRSGATADGTMAYQCVALPAKRTATSPERSHGGIVRLLPNMQLSAPADVDLELLFLLEPYLERPRRGLENRYSFSKESLWSGIEQGGSLEKLRALLDRPGVQVAEGVLPRLGEWARDYGRFTLEAILLLSATSEEDAERVQTLPGVAPCLEARVGPSSYRVSPERIWELSGTLKRAGFPPRVSSEARSLGLRRVTADVELLKECLFALRLLRVLHEGVSREKGPEAIRRLEAALDPEEVAEVIRRVQDVVQRLR